MSADRRGYRGRSWRYWSQVQLRRYDESRRKRLAEFAQTLDEIEALPTVAECLPDHYGDRPCGGFGSRCECRSREGRA